LRFREDFLIGGRQVKIISKEREFFMPRRMIQGFEFLGAGRNQPIELWWLKIT
jgi:hypothetical protein